MRKQVTCCCSAYPFPHRKTGGKCKGIYKITPKAGCQFCHGYGYVTEYHPYGDTVAGEDLICDCVGEQLLEEFNNYEDEIEIIDNGWQGDDGPEFEYDEELDR